MKVLKIAQTPPPAVQVTSTIKEAIPSMGSQHGCGVAVLDGEKLVGCLSRDDVMLRVIGAGLNVETTKVGEVMMPAATVSVDTEAKDALEAMYSSGKCYLGVVDGKGTLKAWLSVCNLFHEREEDLTRQVDSLISYLGADGPGG